MPFGGLYAASKFAVAALAEAASYELRPLGIDSLIIEPETYGTNFGRNVLLGEDQARMQEYGRVKELFEGFLSSMGARTPGDPQEVVDAIVAAVDAADPPPALRLPIGAQMTEPIELINETSKAVQQQLLSAFGM